MSPPSQSTILMRYPDEVILALARTERRILITNDCDFGDLIFRRQLPHAGVIYFRLSLASTFGDKIARLQVVLARHAADLDHFLVVTARNMRVRKKSAQS